MKFSEIEKAQWDELQPYLDTCLLPITGLTGMEAPWKATEILENLRDIMRYLEVPYKGRIVTYPAIHYSQEPEQLCPYVNQLCDNLKKGGFTFVIIITLDAVVGSLTFDQADLLIHSRHLIDNGKSIPSVVEKLWQSKAK
jgi:23S rRNA (pseudouridine1915-N3)-methyltransferase